MTIERVEVVGAIVFAVNTTVGGGAEFGPALVAKEVLRVEGQSLGEDTRLVRVEGLLALGAESSRAVHA